MGIYRGYLSKFCFCALAVLLVYSCGNKASEKEPSADNPKWKEALTQIPEFMAMQKHVDSLQETGVNATVSIEVVQKSFFPEDSLRDIKLIILSEDIGFASSQSYIIKFDNSTDKILEVIDNRTKKLSKAPPPSY